MKALLVIAAVVIAFLAGLFVSGIPGDITGRIVGQEAFVVGVVDGDTLELEDGQRVRLLGINTPEKGQSYYKEATEVLRDLILNRTVLLETDESDRDKYGRLLRHVYVNGENVGLVLIREGYANTFFISPDLKHMQEFQQAERYAQGRGLGIWTRSRYTDCIGIPYFRYNADGDDKENLNGEYVEFSNTCSFSISMIGWTVKDEATHIYDFPDFSLGPQQKVTLYTGSGEDSLDELYWGETWSVWNNDGDTLYMRDSEGNLVLAYGY
jgi:micrococcal nuclease